MAITKAAIVPVVSSLKCSLDVGPLHTVILINLRNGLIYHQFPVLGQNFAQLQQNAIVTQIANFSQQTELNQVQDE